MSAILNKLQSLWNKVVNMIQRALVTGAVPIVPGSWYIVQISNTPKRSFAVPTFNKTTPMEVISPYGLAGCLPQEALSLKFNIQGESSKQAGIGYDPNCLPALAINEVAIGAFAAPVPTYLKFTNEGTIQVWKAGVIVINDLITHIHSGVTTGAGVSGPPVT